MIVTAQSLAELCATTMPDEGLTLGEIEHVCFGPGNEVIGDLDGAIAFTISHFGGHVALWILLVAVRPEVQGKGRGTALVEAALARARELGATTAHLASSVPRYLWPGVEIANTRAGALFERTGFERDAVAVNMTIPTSFRLAAPEGIIIEREETARASTFASRMYPHWRDELAIAVERGTAFAARDAFGETIGFGCHSCNRTAWIGPMATNPDFQHGGVGSAVLGAICADLGARGHASGEIAWVSNYRFYGKCGATVSRVFQGGRRRL
ncbi:MAG: GNAT family N-acetyltransferase [Actinomycetota bacterium]